MLKHVGVIFIIIPRASHSKLLSIFPARRGKNWNIIPAHAGVMCVIIIHTYRIIIGHDIEVLKSVSSFLVPEVTSPDQVVCSLIASPGGYSGVGPHYITLNHTKSHYITLYHTISHYIAQCHTISYYITLYRTISHYITLHHTTSH